MIGKVDPVTTRPKGGPGGVVVQIVDGKAQFTLETVRGAMRAHEVEHHGGKS